MPEYAITVQFASTFTKMARLLLLWTMMLHGILANAPLL